MKKLIFCVPLLLLGTSCVAPKKFKASEAMKNELSRQNTQLQNNLSLERMTVQELDRSVRGLRQDTAELGSKARRYEQLFNSTMQDQNKLSAIIEKRMQELAERESTIDYLQSLINAQNERVSELLRSVQEALLGFHSDDLTVSQRDGKVYIAMSDKLLFQSGSARLDNKGKDALSKLAQVMNKQSDIDVFIEGHTDSKPINTAQFKDNWDLSVVRATSVARILTQEYGVNPLQILPSGRAEFMPVADNATLEGRSKNRRTEIIIAPKLDKLLEILQ